MSQINGRKKILIRLLILMALAVAGVFGYHIYNIRSHITTDDAYIEGRVHIIASKIPGTVMKVAVTDNQSVKKGDLLIEIEPRDYDLKVNEASAALEAEISRLRDAESGVKVAESSLEIEQLNLNQASLDKGRAEALFKEGVVPKERYEKSDTAYNLARARVKAANEQLEKAGSLKALEESMVKQREAALKIAQLNLSYAKIYAPADGYVTKKSVEAGNQIQPNAPLMAVVALDDIWLVANYKETQLKNVLEGQKVIIKVDTYPGKVFTGRVESIMAGTGAVFSLFPPENSLGNYVKVVQRIPVKIIFDDHAADGYTLRVGMSCVPTILTRK